MTISRIVLCSSFLITALFATQPAQINAQQQTQTSPSDQVVSDVLKMKHAGLSDELIIQHFKSEGKSYSFSPDQLMRMKAAGVHDAVLESMMSRANTGGDATSAEDLSSAPLPTEIGVYLVKQGQFTEVLPEVANFKTGGAAKSVASLGVVKGDVNGHVSGAASRNRLIPPFDLLVVMRDGDAITEYQLLKLRQHGDNREFRSVTGGVFHVSGGATRDLIAFDSKKVASRTYLVSIPKTIGVGEFGLLPPIEMQAHSAGGGKLYSFGVSP